MIEMINKILKSIYFNAYNEKEYDKYDGFFKALNDILKGSNDTLIKIEPSDLRTYLLSNILNDYMAIIHLNDFNLFFKDYIMAFSDNKELMYDIFKLMLEYGIIELNDTIRLELFNRLYNSGYFCYVALNSIDFKNEWDISYYDLKIIANIVSINNINDMELSFSQIMEDMYYFKDLSLKDVLI